ncbi:hypothetical protein C8R44DRAFT_892565 [Mycena epipterygia]|nr:hypothetical protein C8R44DRAFT_892565 [Mycena epipterygia]
MEIIDEAPLPFLPSSGHDSDSDPDLFAPHFDIPLDIDSGWDFDASEDEFSDRDDEQDGMEIDPTSESACSSSSDEIVPPSIDLDPWSSFNEFQDLDEPLTLEEMMKKLDEMAGPGDEAAIWDASEPFYFHISSLSNIVACWIRK